ncbi:hypothetical protein [Dactylosporangium sp. CA-139066]|uniref:hypothetical protein n=1 Tax=Dactylosporangium sp. CA-139066 TaxID=3239930 RepID=UPI003D8AA33A
MPSGGPARVQTLSEDRRDKSAVLRPERVIDPAGHVAVAGAAAEINAAWQRAMEPAATALLGGSPERLLAQAWQPVHCATLRVVGEALDDVWTNVVPEAEASTVVVRLGGLPALAAMITADVVRRTSASGPSPAALTGELLRFSGITVCAATAGAAACDTLRGVCGSVTAVPEQRLLRTLTADFVPALGATESGLTLQDILAGGDSAPDYAHLVPQQEPRPPASGPLERSIVATAVPVDGPSTRAIFGTR